MVEKHLVVNLEEDEWRALILIRGLVGANSWNEFAHMVVRDPSKFITNIIGRKNLLSDMKILVEKIGKEKSEESD